LASPVLGGFLFRRRRSLHGTLFQGNGPCCGISCQGSDFQVGRGL
jgi:hypothetical protein